MLFLEPHLNDLFDLLFFGRFEPLDFFVALPVGELFFGVAADITT